MLESQMEELIAKYPQEFFPRKNFKLLGRQGSFAGIGRYDLLFLDEHDTNILLELKARTAKYEDASQLAKYSDAFRQNGYSNILMWLIAPFIPMSIRDFLDRLGIEYSEIHNNEFCRVAQKYNMTIDKSMEEFFESAPSNKLSASIQIAINSDECFASSPLTSASCITDRFRFSMEHLKISFPAALRFLLYIENHSDEGFWLSTSTNAHLYYKNSFLAYIKLSPDKIWFSPNFHQQICGNTVDRSRFLFPTIFRRLTNDSTGKTASWARFIGDGSVFIFQQAPEKFFADLLTEIILVHNQKLTLP